MRFAILGSGAIGAYVGAALARGGSEVVLIARGPQLAALQRERRAGASHREATSKRAYPRPTTSRQCATSMSS